MKKLCICLLAAGLMVLGGGSPSAYAGEGGATINGDVNCDGGFDMSDAIYTLSFLFLGGEAPCPLAAQPDQAQRIEELEGVVDTQAAEIAALNAELLQVRGDLADRLSSLIEAERTLLNCERTLVVSEDRLSTCEVAREAFENEMINTQGQLIRAERSRDAFESELVTTTAQLQVCLEELDINPQLDVCLGELVDTREQMTAELTSAQEELAICNSQRQEGEGNLLEVQEQLEVVQGGLAAAEARIAELEDPDDCPLCDLVCFDCLESPVGYAGLDLRMCNFEGANLQFSGFRDSDLRGVSLSRANLSETILCGADFSGANLRGANLEDADAACNRNPANFQGADLSGVNLRGAHLGRVDFSEANLEGSSLEEADLGDTNLSGANLSGVYFGGANIRDANLSGANLRSADMFLVGGDLGTVDFSGADMRGLQGLIEGQSLGGNNPAFLPDDSACDLVEPGAFLRNMNLRECELEGQDLRGTNLEMADLRGANLQGADLRWANVEGADFRGATGVNLEGTAGIPAFMPDDPLDE